MPATATRKPKVSLEGAVAQAALEIFVQKMANPAGRHDKTTDHLARESFREARVFLEVAQQEQGGNNGTNLA